MKIHLLTRPCCLFSPRAEPFAHLIQNRYGKHSLAECDVLVVLGGDGFMLHQIHRYMLLGKPFFGINFGTKGALMNASLCVETLLDQINQARSVTIHPLHFSAHRQSGHIFQGYALNEISVQRMRHQIIKWTLTVNHQTLVREARGDGVLVATPLGSSAYNASAGGPIVSVEVPALVITPLHCAEPKGWPSHIVPDTHPICITLSDPDRRPGYAGIDIRQYTYIHQVIISKAYDVRITLLFSSPPLPLGPAPHPSGTCHPKPLEATPLHL